jgi:hypothetical protein
MVAQHAGEAGTLASRRTAMAQLVVLGLNDCADGERVST